MPVPAPVKTWEHDENKVVGDASEILTNQNQMFEMVTSMINSGIFTTPWIVRGSSDSSVGAMDGVNRWVSKANVVANNTLGSAHSWIVLEQPGIEFDGAANPLQLLITMNGGTFAEPLIWRSFVISPRDGFTGGDASNDPTATDRWAPYWRSSWLGGGVFGSLVQTVSMSNDGEITRIIIGNGSNVGHRILTLEVPRDPHPDWETPFVFISKGAGNFAIIQGWTNTVTDLGGQNTGVRFLNKEGAPVGEIDEAGYAKQGRAFLAQWMHDSNNALRQTATDGLHDIGGEFATSPAVIYSDSPGNEGVWGELEDWYFIGDDTSIGDAIPGTGEKTWWVLGDIVVPGKNDSATDIDL